MSENTITPTNFDAAVKAVRYAVKARGTWAKYVTDNAVTRETVKDHAAALAALAYPSDEPVQKTDGKRTRFGNAVQAAGNGMRSALDKDSDTTEDDTTDYLAKIIAAVDNGVTHNLNAADIAAAVQAHVDSLLS